MTIPQVKKEQEKNGRPGKVKVSSSNKQERGIVPTKSGFKRATSETVYVNGEVKDAVMKRAQELEASLPRNFPAMIKLMLPSHISGGFWLRLLAEFCHKHLPEEDSMIELEDENGEVDTTKYLAYKNTFSAGWAAFASKHDLVEGDVLVFVLLKPTKFKVYVVRASASEQASRRSKRKVEPSAKEAEKTSITNCKIIVHKDEPKNGSKEDFGFDISDGIIMSSDQPAVDFQQVKNFDDFDIVVNGLIINCELSKQLQYKYYELCSSQKSFLHQHIPNGLNCKLIAGIIAETTNIADAVRTAKFGTRQKEEFATWENTLSGFEKLGMNVEFC
ncbi:unnamed protein product [Linum tenue]|uniref:TF-B3 domain-containing protein n=1 Tax=Linum tenue TaxID=586396 RepID=A0AAV0NET6_9ROSI|nr:unnamed protein product [Linum tenue]